MMTLFTFVAALFLAAPAPSALQLRVNTHVGMAPLTLTAKVRQDVDAVQGREVCLFVNGESISCWKSDVPDLYVTRSFQLSTPGDYTLYAAWRGGESNHEAVIVKGIEHD